MVKEKREKISNEEKAQIANLGIQNGLKELIKINPQYKDFIQEHINEKKINKKFYGCLKELEKNNHGLEKNEIKEYLSSELEEYIASGEALDERGQKIIKGLEKEARSGFFKGHDARKKLKKMSKHEEYLKNIENAFRDINSITGNEEAYQKNPELTRIVTEINHKTQILNPATELLYSYGLISTNEYNSIQKSIGDKIEDDLNTTKELIQKYANSEPKTADDYQKTGLEKIAASILGIVGVSIFISTQTNMTANVISNLTNTTNNLIGLAGIGLLLVSAMLFIKKSKKK